MKITFSPVRADERLLLERHGDTLVVNGARFDFAVVPEGASLPAEAVDSPWFCDVIERHDGVLHLSMLLPHGPAASEAALFPHPVEVLSDGPIDLPEYEVTR